MPDSHVPGVRPSRIASFLRAPAVHFTVAGAVLFAGTWALGGNASARAPVAEVSREIVIGASRIDQLKYEWAVANHGNPNLEQTRDAVENLVTSEILLREALASGLEQGDRAIQWRLVQKMRYLGEDHGEDIDGLARRAFAMGLHRSDPIVRQILIEKIRLVIGRTGARATDEELGAYFAEHRGEYAQAGRVSFRHVFFDRGRRGGNEEAKQAASAAASASAGRASDVAASLGGDTFLSGEAFAAQSRVDIAKYLGPGFADQVLAMPAGEWKGPIESPFGWHLVWVDKRLDARLPELAEVRSQVMSNYEHARSRERVEEFVTSRRKNYDIRIAEAALAGPGHG